MLLRPSSTKADSALPPVDVWTWKQLGERGTELTKYPVHSVFEDFTWDKSETMSGAADDWAYDHLGVFSWTTEFWDVIFEATGHRCATEIWYTGPTVEEELAIAKWCDEQPDIDGYVEWQPFNHPQLGAVEIGGLDWFNVLTNPPLARLAEEVRPHAEFAVFQALASPRLEILLATATAVGDDLWQVEVGIANTGWLPTTVTTHARKQNLVLPIAAELDVGDDGEIVNGVNRQLLGQLSGRSAYRLDGGSRNDGTPDRVLARWFVRGSIAGATVTVQHQRAGTQTATITVR